MREVHWCHCCRQRDYDCKCTQEQLARYWKLDELERARATVSRLQSELGATSSVFVAVNRKTRRHAAAIARKGKGNAVKKS
jgi:hypothetical protein